MHPSCKIRQLVQPLLDGWMSTEALSSRGSCTDDLVLVAVKLHILLCLSLISIIPVAHLQRPEHVAHVAHLCCSNDDGSTGPMRPS